MARKSGGEHSRTGTPAQSPLAPERFPNIPEIAGVRLSAVAAGVRYRGRKDVMLAELAPGTTVGGVFTRSRTAAAPVEWCREKLKSGRARAVLVNAGNANAFTGFAGMSAAETVAKAVATELSCRPAEVFLASTGVIGEPLPHERITRALARLRRGLSGKAWRSAAEAIRTTDTFPKAATAVAEIDGKPYRIAGIAKGSGMIAPDMATMLAFVFTDARLPDRRTPAPDRDSQSHLFQCDIGGWRHVYVRHGPDLRDRPGTPASAHIYGGRSAPRGFQDEVAGGHDRPRTTDRSRRGRSVEVRDGHGIGCGITPGRTSDRVVYCQFTSRQDGDCGERSQLGADCHGRRQGGGKG